MFDAQKIIDEHGGKCKSRNGRDAVIYAVHPDQSHAYKVHGAILVGGSWDPANWTADGKINSFENDNARDLVMPRTVVATQNLTLNKYRSTLGHVDYDGGVKVIIRLYSDNTVESEIVS